MTAGTGTHHLAVIHPGDRAPAIGGMTGVTAVTALNVARRFSGGGQTVMTAETIATDVAVIKAAGLPGGGGMTG